METNPVGGPVTCFLACECGRHGRIMLASGFRGAEVAFKQHALHFVRTGVQWERLSDEEVEKVTKEILASSLPMTPEEADEVMIYNAEVFNVMCMEDGIGECSSVSIHVYMQTPVDPNEFPHDLLEKVHAMLRTAAPH